MFKDKKDCSTAKNVMTNLQQLGIRPLCRIFWQGTVGLCMNQGSTRHLRKRATKDPFKHHYELL